MEYFGQLLGNKQWGYLSSGSGTITISFPISFTSTGFTVVCQAVSGGKTGSAWGQLTRGSVTTTGYRTTLDGEGSTYVAFGQ